MHLRLFPHRHAQRDEYSSTTTTTTTTTETETDTYRVEARVYANLTPPLHSIEQYSTAAADPSLAHPEPQSSTTMI